MGPVAAKEPDKSRPEDLVWRIMPARPGRFGLSRIGARGVALGVLLSAAAFSGVILLLFRDRGLSPRARVEFPSRPNLEAAIAQAQERLRANPQDIAALVELGTLQFEKGREYYPEAINELEDARELGALDARIFYCLGVMYQEVGLYSFALQEYQRYLRNYPEDKEVRLLAAKLLYRQGSYAEAVAEYERLKFHFPNDPLIEENLALSLWGAKAADRALESFSALAAGGGEQARRAELYLGQIYLERIRFPEALEHLLRAETPGGVPGIAPEKLYAALGTAYQKLGRPQEAKASWERVLAAVPGDAKALAALREIRRRFPSKRQAKTRT